MIEVTENWSAAFVSRVPPWNAGRQFVVTGTSNENAALTAVDPVTGVRVIQRGEGHAANPTRIICQGPKVSERKGPQHFVIDCPYSLDFGMVAGTADDPLDDPPRISWTSAVAIYPVDHDFNFRPILNAAGEIFSGSTRTVYYKKLRITKNFPFFDLLLTGDFQGATNFAPVIMGGGTVTVASQHMICTDISPAVQDFPPEAPFLPIAFEFDVMPKDVLGKYPFQTRQCNAGKNGWYLDSGGKKQPGRFCTLLGVPIERDVLLNETGTPLKYPNGTGTVKVLSAVDDARDPVTPPHAVTPDNFEFYKYDGTIQAGLTAANDDTAAVFMYYKGARVVDFGPLLSLL